MKKFTALCVAIALFLGVSSTAIEPIKTIASVNDPLVIAVDEELGNLDIFTQTEYSSSADYVYRMVYDRLLEFNEQGELCYSLATNIYLLEEDGDGNIPENMITSGGWLLNDFTFTEDWEPNEIPGWKSQLGEMPYDLQDLNFFYYWW